LTELDDPVYRTRSEAARSLSIPGDPPKYSQIVEITKPVDAVKSGISGGAPGATQLALPRKDVYRVIPESEVPLK
jgi:hypothetical protein